MATPAACGALSDVFRTTRLPKNTTTSCTSGFTEKREVPINIVQFCCKFRQSILGMHSSIFAKKNIVNISKLQVKLWEHASVGLLSSKQVGVKHPVPGGVVHIQTPRAMAWNSGFCCRTCSGQQGAEKNHPGSLPLEFEISVLGGHLQRHFAPDSEMCLQSSIWIFFLTNSIHPSAIEDPYFIRNNFFGSDWDR